MYNILTAQILNPKPLLFAYWLSYLYGASGVSGETVLPLWPRNALASLLYKFFILATASLSNHSIFSNNFIFLGCTLWPCLHFFIPYLSKSETTFRVPPNNLKSQTFPQTFIAISIILRVNEKSFIWTPPRSACSPIFKRSVLNGCSNLKNFLQTLRPMILWAVWI